MSHLPEDDQLLHIILQHLREHNLTESLHVLQRESGVHFDVPYIESLVQEGMFNEIKTYFQGFISYGDDGMSMKIFYEITKQKFLEAIYLQDYPAATSVLLDELLLFKVLYKDDIPRLMHLLLNESYQDFNKSQEAQGVRVPDLSNLVEAQANANRQKFKEEDSPLNNFDIKNSRASLAKLLKDCINAHPSLKGKCYIYPFESSRLKVLCKQSRHWQHSQCHTKIHDFFNSSNSSGILYNHNCEVSPSSGLASMRNVLHVPRHPSSCLDASVRASCFEFHPVDELTIAVGTLDGSLFLRRLGNLAGEDITKSFSVWNPFSYSSNFLASSSSIFVTCIRWSPCGRFVALGFSQNLVHLYSFEDCSGLQRLHEIEAHRGSVNDVTILAEKSIVITCGEDCVIKTWNLEDGASRGILTGHTSNVKCLSVCLNEPELLIYSVADGGEVKVWKLMSGEGYEVSTINYDGSIDYMVSNLDGSVIYSCGLDLEDYPCLT